MTPQDIAEVQIYLRKRFSNSRIVLVPRAKKDDSVEVTLDDEFLGVVYKDQEDGETCFHFQMSILDIDLEDV
ncbi:MAG: DUF3126 family protein [Alphaproteobacteria bacterium]|nr:DUF3126 family protein [Alphaproteobacteria bacterium]